MNKNKLENLNIIEMMNEISKIEGDCLLDQIIGWCDKTDKDPQEVGDILSENEQFKDKLERDLIKNNVFKDPLYKKALEETEWTNW